MNDLFVKYHNLETDKLTNLTSKDQDNVRNIQNVILNLLLYLIYVFTINLLYILIISLIFLATPVDFYFQLDSAAARIVKSINFCLAFFALYNLNAKNVQLSK